jgi:hypothetical protein
MPRHFQREGESDVESHGRDDDASERLHWAHEQHRAGKRAAKLACAWAVVCYATQTRMDLARSSVLHVLTPSPERPLPNAELVLRRESQPHSEGAVRDGGIARLGSVKKIRLDGYARETDRACAILVTGP